MAEEEIKFIDAEAYTGRADEKLTFRMIVLEQLRRIGKLASVEWHGGFWEDRTKITAGASVQEHVYVQDTREEYTNAIDFLFDILYPHFDSEIKKDIEEFEKYEEETEKKLYEKYTEKTPEGKKILDKNSYKSDKVRKIKRRLFRILNSFLKRNRYMEAITAEEDL